MGTRYEQLSEAEGRRSAGCMRPAEPASPIDLIKYAMEQHGLTASDVAPILGTRSRASEILNGKRPLTLAMIRRIRERLGLPADLLIADRAAA